MLQCYFAYGQSHDRESSVQYGVMHSVSRMKSGIQSSSQSQRDARPVKGRDHQQGTRLSRGQ